MRENEGTEMCFRKSEFWALCNLENEIQIIWLGVGVLVFLIMLTLKSNSVKECLCPTEFGGDLGSAC